MNPYITDILSQPVALRDAVKNYSPASLAAVVRQIQSGTFDRIVMTGMGASFNAAYPAYAALSNLSAPVVLANAAELVYNLNGLIGSRTLLWVNSQSGQSAELLHLLERIKSNPPVSILACVNDETSPLAAAADVCLPIHAGPEATVSTKTYINTLAVNLLAAQQIASQDVETLKSRILAASDETETWLKGWQARLDTLDRILGDFRTLVILGRGTSLAAVWNGSLINKEAAKCAFEGMHAAEFRHGPLELAEAGFCALFFAGSPRTFSLNRRLAVDIREHGARVVWLDSREDPDMPTFTIPAVDDPARPIVEILPVQLLSLVMAKRKGIDAGIFRIVGKVTTTE